MHAHKPGVSLRRFVALMSLLTLGANQAGGETSQDPTNGADNVRLRHAGYALAVRQALVRASRALRKPSCQRVFREFGDETGQPLQNRLDAEGKSGEGYLTTLLFYDGSRHPRCGQKQTFAVARPGSRVVLICTPQFADIALRKQRLAASLLIHEELHALGLGENPPTSSEITARVSTLCSP